ncbi:hypothetical protein C3L33_05065, partial [Rhododendron williamsianum]
MTACIIMHDMIIEDERDDANIVNAIPPAIPNAQLFTDETERNCCSSDAIEFGETAAALMLQYLASLWRTGHVIKLHLRNPIPSNGYNYVDYRINKLTGEMTPSFVDLKHLSYLDLSGNNISGLDFLGSLKSLRYLSLSFVLLGGKVPHNLGNLSRLQYLDLSNNDFDGPIHNLGNLSRLQHLDLHRNNFDGPILDTLGSLTSLTFLDLHWNSFNDTVKEPYVLCNLSRLVYVDLRDNSLQGSVPYCFGNHTSLSVLKLSENGFEGPLPSCMGNMTQLTVLDLHNNGFKGEIPNSLRNLRSLRVLDLSFNKFNGEILSSVVGEFKNLECLLISGLGQLSNLQMLDLSSNSLDGNVSEQHFTTLKNLNELRLSSNSLVINVSSQWVPPFQLQVLEMASCKLGPQFPQWLQTQRHVTQLAMSNASISDIMPNWFELIMSSCFEYLDISNNRIRGTLPKFQMKCNYSGSFFVKRLIFNPHKFDSPLLALLSSISILDLSNNLFSGPIPVADYDEIDVLILSNNHFSGGIPVSLCNAAGIALIDLSKNHLSGKIPPCLGNLRRITVLDLSSNNLHGQIPSSLGFLQRLEYLHLRNNSFHGELPLSLQNLTGMVTLDLDENAFTGVIPRWIGDKLHNLVFLSLQSNNFYGGRELEYTRTLKFVSSIDVSSNGIIGEIPEDLTNLSGLWNLNLSGNHLTGRIPEKIGDMKQLESLDFSRNKLFGSIPQSLSSLTSLSHLNLSFNNLSGRIPTGNQLQTLNDRSIYEGNDRLCGAPLTKGCPGDESADDGDRQVLVNEGDRDDDDAELMWFYAGIGPGFVVGLLGVFCTLYFKRKWRYAYFQLIEDAYDRIFVAIAVKANWLRRKFHPQR